MHLKYSTTLAVTAQPVAILSHHTWFAAVKPVCHTLRGRSCGGRNTDAQGTQKWHSEHRRWNLGAQGGAETSKNCIQLSRCSQNRMQKYGGNHANDFADPDFLFDFAYIRGLSRLLVAVCRAEYCITPVIKHWQTCEKWLASFSHFDPGDLPLGQSSPKGEMKC